MRIISDQFYCGYAFDDEVLDNPETVLAEAIPLIQQILHIMNHPESPCDDNSHLAAMQDITLRLRDYSSPVAYRRWLHGYITWLYGAAGIISHRAMNSRPKLNEFITLGVQDRGIDGTITCIEVAERTTLPDAARNRPRTRILTAAAITVTTLDHDLFGYQRESVHDTIESNIVTAVMDTHQVGLQDAIIQAVVLRDRILTLYLTLRDRELACCAPETRTYLSQLDNLIRGTLDWVSTSPRHNADTGRGARTVAEFADKPYDGRLMAPPLPAIAWWWDELR